MKDALRLLIALLLPPLAALGTTDDSRASSTLKPQGTAVASAAVGRAAVPGPAFDKTFLDQHRSDYPARGFEWENNRIGVSDQVPAPWRPVAVRDGEVRLTHRRLELGGKDGPALIRQITSLDQPLLAEGIAFRLEDGSGVAHHLTCDSAPVSATDSEAVFHGITCLPGGRAVLECRIEFDGFLHLGLDLEPDAGAEITVHDLRLTAVLARAAASHYKYFIPYNFTTEELGDSGRLPSTGPVEKELRLPFSPVFWLGTPEVGLEWMCETNQGWNLKDALDAVHVQPFADRVVWTNHFINQPIRVARPRHFACAFYVLPARPAGFAGWNRDAILVNSDPILDFKESLAPWRIYYGVHRNTSPTPGHPVARGRTLTARLRHFGVSFPYPDGPQARRYEREREELREKGIRYLPYTILHGLPSDLPSDDMKTDAAWLKQWDLGTAKEGHKHYILISHHHKSAADFQLFYAIRAIREHGIQGQYFDLAQPRSAAGYARRMTSDFGGESFYMPIFGYREFSKRFYIAATEIDPEFLVIQHAVIPTGISSAYSLSSGGEHLKQFFRADGDGRTHRIDEEGRTVLAFDPKVYDPDYFRVPDMMHPVGNWFPVFGQTLTFTDFMKGTGGYFRDHPDRRAYYARTFLARSLTHGLHVWQRQLDIELVLPIWKAFDRFGPLTESTSIHTALDPETHLLNEDKTVIEYRVEQKPDRLLLIVSNGGQEATTAGFDVGAMVEAPAGWIFTNAETGEVLALRANATLEIAIPKHDFRMVLGQQ